MTLKCNCPNENRSILTLDEYVNMSVRLGLSQKLMDRWRTLYSEGFILWCNDCGVWKYFENYNDAKLSNNGLITHEVAFLDKPKEERGRLLFKLAESL